MTDKDYDKLKLTEEAIRAFDSKKLHESSIALSLDETVTNCHGLKMLAAEGKFYKTDVADTEQLFRLIQSTINLT